MSDNDTVIMREIRIIVRVDDQLSDEIQSQLLETFDEMTSSALSTLISMVNLVEERLQVTLDVDVWAKTKNLYLSKNSTFSVTK
jgi:hypothetical protein